MHRKTHFLVHLYWDHKYSDSDVTTVQPSCPLDGFDNWCDCCSLSTSHKLVSGQHEPESSTKTTASFFRFLPGFFFGRGSSVSESGNTQKDINWFSWLTTWSITEVNKTCNWIVNMATHFQNKLKSETKITLPKWSWYHVITKQAGTRDKLLNLKFKKNLFKS